MRLAAMVTRIIGLVLLAVATLQQTEAEIAAATAAAAAKAGGCNSRVGRAMPPVLDADGKPSCAPSFYCPALDPANATSYPLVCLAAPECQVARLLGGRCDPQGALEPRLCDAGFYCPTYRQMIQCPAGHFCPAGAVTPRKCGPVSICKAGAASEKSLDPLVVALVLLAAAAAVWMLHRWVVQANYCWESEGFTSPRRTRDIDDAGDSDDDGENDSRSSEPTALSLQFSDPVGPAAPANARSTIRGLSPLVMARRAAATRQDTGELCDGLHRVRAGRPPLDIVVRDLRVALPDGRTVLQGANGALRPGTVTAIMGPTGAGKTVFMTALLGGLQPDWSVTGQVLLNGEELELTGSGLRQLIGFVPQDDVLHQELTVDANLFFASELRLPAGWLAGERSALRCAIRRRLGVDDDRDKIVGVPARGGLGPSQRKRVSVAAELSALPLALFLDEPTSGLDGTKSLELVKLLKEVAVDSELTVAMVVHQPRVEIWAHLDELLLLAPGGYTVYQGPQSEAVKYFGDHGVNVRPQDNPADAIMDAIALEGDRLVECWRGGGLGSLESAGGPTPGTEPSPVPVGSHLRESDRRPDDSVRSPQLVDGSPKSPGQATEVTESDTDASATTGGSTTRASTTRRLLAAPLVRFAQRPRRRSAVDVAYDPDAVVSTGESSTSASVPPTPTPAEAGQTDTDSSTARSSSPDPVASTRRGRSRTPLSCVLRSGYAAARRRRRPTVPSQVLIFLRRSLEKQLLTPMVFIIEIGVLLLLGFVVGWTADTATPTGIYREPYDLVSPLTDGLLPLLNMYTFMSISFTAAVTAVGIFGTDRPNYFRDAQAGLSRVAYFVGTVLSILPRTVVAIAVFTASYFIIADTLLDKVAFPLTVWLAYLTVYGISACVAFVVQRSNAPLVATMIGGTMGVFAGFIDFPHWLKRIFMPFHGAQYLQYKTVPLVDGWTDRGMGETFGYSRTEAPWSPLVMVLWIVAVYSLAFVLMIKVDKAQQR